jgi:tetratricopeptide (TPR) repeat protein
VKLILGDAKEGVRYLNEIETIIPSNPDVLFGRGLYNYYVEAVKEDYPAISPIVAFFASGNKKAGLQMLEIAAKDASYARTEAKYELLKIYYSYEKNYGRAQELAQELVNRYPNNVIFLHYLGFSQVTAGLPYQYDSTYRVILARCRERREAYTIRQAREAMYFIGYAQLQIPTGNLDTALYYMYNSDMLSRKILPPEKLDWYVTKAELFMGEAYDAKGDRKRALEMYHRVLELQDFSGAHADAQRYIETPFKR